MKLENARTAEDLRTGAMVAALESCAEWMYDPDDVIGQFDRINELYMRDTGYMRPGKDGVYENTGSDENHKRFNDWCEVNQRKRLAIVRAALSPPVPPVLDQDVLPCPFCKTPGKAKRVVETGDDTPEIEFGSDGEARAPTLTAAPDTGAVKRTQELEDAVEHALTTLICSCAPFGNVDVDDASEIKHTIDLLQGVSRRKGLGPSFAELNTTPLPDTSAAPSYRAAFEQFATVIDEVRKTAWDQRQQGQQHNPIYLEDLATRLRVVRDAIFVAAAPQGAGNGGEVAALKKQIAILELKNRGTLANNLCPDCRDKQTDKPCLGCTVQTLERQLAALKASHAGLLKAYYEVAATGLGTHTNHDEILAAAKSL